jgi:hypothetical protein
MAFQALGARWRYAKWAGVVDLHVRRLYGAGHEVPAEWLQALYEGIYAGPAAFDPSRPIGPEIAALEAGREFGWERLR